MRRRVVILAMAIFMVAAAGVFWWSSGHTQAGKAPLASASGPLTISAPATAQAGQEVAVRVDGVGTSGTVRLAAIGSMGSVTMTSAAERNTAAFVLPPKFTKSAGIVTLVASVADATVSASCQISPGPVVAPLETAVGARSIVADAEDMSMAVTVPVDKWGNAVAKDTAVRFSRVNPSGTVTQSEVRTSGLLAWLELGSGTIAGTGSIAAGSGDVVGPGVSLDEVAGRPVPYTVEIAEEGGAPRLADGQSLFSVKTSTLRDKFGNLEADGTDVRLRWNGPNGQGSAQAVTIGGTARFTLRTPSIPGQLDIISEARGTESAPISVSFSPAVSRADVQTQVNADGALEIYVGPVVDVDGRLAPDGARVTASLVGTSGDLSTTSGQLRGGYAALTIRRSDAATGLRVAVLGFSVDGKLP